jgi:pantothenate synthetase
LSENLIEANKRADSLARKLEQKEKALKKAESDAAVIEDLRKRLHEAETALSDNVAEQAAREKEILSRLQSQSRLPAISSGCQIYPCALFDELSFACF